LARQFSRQTTSYLYDALNRQILKEAGMHVIVYILDALRADHLSCYGYDRQTSPHLDGLASEGVLFENCFTSSTWTRPVAASILTGTYPRVHLTRSRYDMFTTSLTRLPEVLRAGGFKTAAFSTMGNIASEIGFSRGFDHYYDLFRDPAILAKRRRLDAAKEGLMHATDEEIALPRAEDINDFLFPWLEEQRAANTFSFIWSIETHVPYTAPDEFRRFSGPAPLGPDEGQRQDIRSAGAADRQRLMNLYDDEIYYNDHCLGQIISHLKALSIYDDTLFVIAGDHGDAFYEHSFYAHGQAPYEELIHVPLIAKFPSAQYAGKRVAGLVELIDIFPTVAAAAGLAPGIAGSTYVQGQNLLGLAAEGYNQREYVFSDTQSLEIHNHYQSVRTKCWKYIERRRPQRSSRTLTSIVAHIIKRRMIFDILRNPRHFLRSYFSGSNKLLFDLAADPGELKNIATERPDLITQLGQTMIKWQQQNDDLAQQVGCSSYSYEESETLRQHLEKLGYM
jgi:arylsulfatase A-like enzyme